MGHSVYTLGVSCEKVVKSMTSIGKLDIIWRTGYGDKGRLQTSQLQVLLSI